MSAAELVSGGGVRLRLRSWRGRPDVCELASLPPGALVPPRLVSTAISRAAAAGYRRIVTPALSHDEWRPYLDAGFAVHEELHLLVHDLLDVPPRAPDARLRRATRADHPIVLAIDHAAFPPFWRLDRTGLGDALDATPSTRFRVDRAHPPTGYCIIGRAGDRGYVQRLAVDPARQGHGLGQALVVDGLWWLRRWRVREAYVNTQVGNDRAMALYQHLGFRRRINGLAVLQVDLAS